MALARNVTRSPIRSYRRNTRCSRLRTSSRSPRRLVVLVVVSHRPTKWASSRRISPTCSRTVACTSWRSRSTPMLNSPFRQRSRGTCARRGQARYPSYLSRGSLILGGAGAPLHFGGRKVLGPGEQDPDMAEWISDARRARAVEHLGQGLLGRAAGSEGARQQGRIVVAEDVQAGARRSQGAWLAIDPAVRVADHQRRAFDRKLGVQDSPVGPGDAEQL